MSHVFVIRGDITSLACDAWMLPTSRRLGLDRWADQVSRLHERAAATDTSAMRSGDRRTAVLAGAEGLEPQVVLTAVPHGGFTEDPDPRPAVEEFFATAAAAIRNRPGRDRRDGDRPRSLIAMPFFATRGGGGSRRRGEILGLLLDAMHSGAKEHDVDAVLVLRDAEAYALAQRKRADDPSSFHELGEPLLTRVHALVPDARSGRLVPFMGAGVSASAGGPSWSALIERLAERVLRDPRAAKSLLHPRRDALDQAAALRAAWDEHPDAVAVTFNEVVAEELNGSPDTGSLPRSSPPFPRRKPSR